MAERILEIMASACVIGSGPNGLSAAIVLAQAGLKAKVYERNGLIGGGCSTAEVTLPGFRHDLGSSVYPMGCASPFFRSLRLDVGWVEPPACCAHPLDDGSAVMLEHSVEVTAQGLDAEDRAAYMSLMSSIVADMPKLIGELLGPVVHLPHALIAIAKFGLSALLPATTLAKLRFKGARARALFSGMAAHSVQPLEEPTSAAVGLVLMAVGHASGWPIVRGGAQKLIEALAARFEDLGGEIETGREISGLSGEEITLADITPRQLLQIAGTRLPESYRRQLERFRYGAGSFKVDYALSEPVPWTARECGRAATVHLGGTLEEVARSERTLAADRPFVLLVQPSLFDASRAPAGQHTAWAYCHVPNGSTVDHLEALEGQIERFAPGFGECVLARTISPPALLEAWNPNLVGGDLSGGAMSPKQLVFRPTASLYRTPVKGLYFCGASTPPGGGVHGMAGFHAAQLALKDFGITGEGSTR